MSDESAFEVDQQQVAAIAQATGAAAIVDAFPAALLAPTWQALLQGGAIKTPAGLDATRVKVHLQGPRTLELLVPVTLKDGDEVVKSSVVRIKSWTANGDMFQQLDSEADELKQALERAFGQPLIDHGGQGQKPHTRA
jgi:hypothetical protein